MGRQQQLKIVSFRRWYRFVKRYPKLDTVLEDAIVKDMDDNHYLIDLNILRKVLKNNGQSSNFDL